MLEGFVPILVDIYSWDDGSSYTGSRIGNFYNWSGYDDNGQYYSRTMARIGNFDIYIGD
jgi:hypothetical protein